MTIKCVELLLEDAVSLAMLRSVYWLFQIKYQAENMRTDTPGTSLALSIPSGFIK